jgi:hypothetical protein
MNKTMQLIFGARTEEIKVVALELNNSTAIIKSFTIVKNQSYLFTVKHKSTITLLDLNAITPYQLLFFDDCQLFTGATFSLGGLEQLFLSQTTAKFILLTPHKQIDKWEYALGYDLY